MKQFNENTNSQQHAIVNGVLQDVKDVKEGDTCLCATCNQRLALHFFKKTGNIELHHYPNQAYLCDDTNKDINHYVRLFKDRCDHVGRHLVWICATTDCEVELMGTFTFYKRRQFHSKLKQRILAATSNKTYSIKAVDGTMDPSCCTSCVANEAKLKTEMEIERVEAERNALARVEIERVEAERNALARVEIERVETERDAIARVEIERAELFHVEMERAALIVKAEVLHMVTEQNNVARVKAARMEKEKVALFKAETARVAAALCGPGCLETHLPNLYYVCSSCKHNPFYYKCGNRRCRRFKNE